MFGHGHNAPAMGNNSDFRKEFIEQEVSWPLWPLGSTYDSVIITQKMCNTYLFFPMANIYLPWPDFAHGPAVFPWEKGFLPWESEL